jgi:hypothetical protein
MSKYIMNDESNEITLESNQYFINKEFEDNINKDDNPLLDYLMDKIDYITNVSNIRQIINNNKIKNLQETNQIMLERIEEMDKLLKQCVSNNK